MYTKQQSPKIHEANTDKIEGKNRRSMIIETSIQDIQ